MVPKFKNEENNMFIKLAHVLEVEMTVYDKIKNLYESS